jgi:hypothetical protein
MGKQSNQQQIRVYDNTLKFCFVRSKFTLLLQKLGMEGGGECFDPMMERGDWISGEAPRFDIVMMEVVIKILAAANQPT